MIAIYVNAKDASWEALRGELAELRAASGPDAEIYFDEEGRGRRFQAMMTRIKGGGVSEVLVHNPQRIGQAEGEIKQAVRQIENSGARVQFLAPEPRPVEEED